ncbi:MAG: hypothetical protein LBU79_01385 [Planctomycetota bacterium]|jgi:hypothetical protein|nr:hypothetical protein [Planctomycetota bacterium]
MPSHDARGVGQPAGGEVTPSRASASRGAFLLEFSLVIAFLLALAGVVFPFLTRMADDHDRRQCLENLQVIGQAIQQWSREHDYALPPGRGMSGFTTRAGSSEVGENLYVVEPGLNALWDKGNGIIKDVNVFRCPADHHLLPPPEPGEDFTLSGQLSYGMTGRIYPTDSPNKVIVADKSDEDSRSRRNRGSPNHNYHFINILFFDGQTMTVPGPVLPLGMGSDPGSIYVRETGDQDDTYIE